MKLIKDFFTYYYDKLPPNLLNRFIDILNTEKTKLIQDTISLIENHQVLNSRKVINFFSLIYEIRRDYPKYSINFNDPTNICFEFFLEYFIESIPIHSNEIKIKHTKFDNFKNSTKDLGFFRKIIREETDGKSLADYYKLSALQNFSSGGENTLLEFFPLIDQKHGKVLDVGCGSGLAACLLSQRNSVTAIDTSPVQIKKAEILYECLVENTINNNLLLSLIKKELEIVDINFDKSFLTIKEGQKPSFQIFDISSKHLPDNTYDFVLCMDVLEHLKNPKDILLKLINSVKRNGKIALTLQTLGTAISQEISEQINNTSFPIMMHINAFNIFDLKEIIKNENCIVNSIKYYNPSPIIDIINNLSRFDKEPNLKLKFEQMVEYFIDLNIEFINELNSRQVFVILKKK